MAIAITRTVTGRRPHMRRKDGRSASSGLRCPRVVLAKCPANRDRDWDFARAALAAGIVDGDELIRRAQLLPLEAELLIVVRTTLAGIAGSVRRKEP
jgi:hypothetical protein